MVHPIAIWRQHRSTGGFQTMDNNDGQDVGRAELAEQARQRDAEARFATFGPRIDASAALRATARGHTVMSYQYGDDDDFVAVTYDELADAINRDGAAAVDGYWGPFAVWTSGIDDGTTGGNADVAAALRAAADVEDEDDLALDIRQHPEDYVAEPEPVDIAAVIAAALAEPNYAGDAPERIIAALGRAGAVILAPQDLAADGCRAAEDGQHELSLTLCNRCLEYAF
jgi:hypothetical protein